MLRITLKEILYLKALNTIDSGIKPNILLMVHTLQCPNSNNIVINQAVNTTEFEVLSIIGLFLTKD